MSNVDVFVGAFFEAIEKRAFFKSKEQKEDKRVRKGAKNFGTAAGGVAGYLAARKAGKGGLGRTLGASAGAAAGRYLGDRAGRMYEGAREVERNLPGKKKKDD